MNFQAEHLSDLAECTGTTTASSAGRGSHKISHNLSKSFKIFQIFHNVSKSFKISQNLSKSLTNRSQNFIHSSSFLLLLLPTQKGKDEEKIKSN